MAVPCAQQLLRARKNHLSPIWSVLECPETDQHAYMQVTDENGQVLSEDDDRRSQYWQFARGPLPPLPAQSVESPWFLLSMQ